MSVSARAKAGGVVASASMAILLYGYYATVWVFNFVCNDLYWYFEDACVFLRDFDSVFPFICKKSFWESSSRFGICRGDGMGEQVEPGEREYVIALNFKKLKSERVYGLVRCIPIYFTLTRAFAQAQSVNTGIPHLPCASFEPKYGCLFSHIHEPLIFINLFFFLEEVGNFWETQKKKHTHSRRGEKK